MKETNLFVLGNVLFMIYIFFNLPKVLVYLPISSLLQYAGALAAWFLLWYYFNMNRCIQLLDQQLCGGGKEACLIGLQSRLWSLPSYQPWNVSLRGSAWLQSMKLWVVPPQPYTSLFPSVKLSQLETLSQQQTWHVFLVPLHLFAIHVPPSLICNVEIVFYRDILTSYVRYTALEYTSVSGSVLFWDLSTFLSICEWKSHELPTCSLPFPWWTRKPHVMMVA